MSNVGESITSYMVAFAAICVDHVDHFLTWGGAVLLVLRLIADGERVRETWRKKRARKIRRI